MSAQAFAHTIISKIKSAIGTDGSGYGSSVASLSMQAVADGITEYILANTTVIISYIGIIPGTPPVPDPTVTDSFRVIGKCAPTGICNGFDDWIRQIEANIIAGFQLNVSGVAGIVFATKPFMMTGIGTTQEAIKAIHVGNADDPQLKVWTQICQDIMNWINLLTMNPAPGPASHPTVGSTGTACITKITIV